MKAPGATVDFSQLVPYTSPELASYYLYLIPLIPLMGAIISYGSVNSNQRFHKLSGWIATLIASLSFLLVVYCFFAISAPGVQAVDATAWTWFEVGSVKAEFALRFDNLAAVMCLIVTGVGSLIHLYAIGYMAEDENRPRFFSYLNLFLFAMLLLVLGDNLLMMFVGWEGVGLCSYLLIGFWFKDMENAKAGQKAFVVNRIGDAGFILGVFVLFVSAGTVNFVELQGLVETLPAGTIELVALLLFIGAVGKSAQVPLYVWLPDAMAGPTPVSALIHAATMVTAGIYMVARMSFLYELAPEVSLLIACIGTITAFLAATIALVQTDIKRVLAYSTVSQLGYMFMAMGVMAYSNGIYHVVTHAFFKACLFMAAGSVIIGCHHEQDMREMGGLAKKMKWTFITYFVATLAIAGVPYLSGFFSKDAILWAVYSSEGLAGHHIGQYTLGQVLWGVGLFTAFLTAFYMTRSLVMTFFGEYRGHAHPHESSWVVCLPLVILASLSAVFGYFFGYDLIHYLESWTRHDMHAGHEHPEIAHKLELVSSVVAVSGVVIAWVIYSFAPGLAAYASRIFSTFYRLLVNKWWVDELYGAIVVKPLRATAGFLFWAIDRAMIDAAVDLTGQFVVANGEIARRAQTGKLTNYALMMFGGTLFVIVFWFMI